MPDRPPVPVLPAPAVPVPLPPPGAPLPLQYLWYRCQKSHYPPQSRHCRHGRSAAIRCCAACFSACSARKLATRCSQQPLVALATWPSSFCHPLLYLPLAQPLQASAALRKTSRSAVPAAELVSSPSAPTSSPQAAALEELVPLFPLRASG